MKKQGRKKASVVNIVGIGAFALILAAFAVTNFVYYKVKADIAGDGDMQAYKGYIRHYVFITDDIERSFWQEVYEGAKGRGEETGVYLEAFGIGTAVEYTKEERMQMAIAAQVDGIVLEADESQEMQQLIDEAVENDIPVVTVMTDSYGSKRQSFIGFGNYNLGREYGRQIVKFAAEGDRKVLVIMDGNMDSNTQNMISTGIREAISNEGNHLKLEVETITDRDMTVFGSEEIVRDIFLDVENLPDIIVCLNEQDTVSACQAAVDYNVVGEVNIIGYYITDTLANALERKILTSTIVTDAGQMGINSVDALNEYIETGHVNDFIVMEVQAITANHMGEYTEDVEKESMP